MKREVTPPFRPQLVHSQHPSHPTTPTTTTTTTNYHTPTLSKLKQTKGVEDVSNFDKKYTSVRPIDSPVNSNDTITLSQENMFLGFSYVCFILNEMQSHSAMSSTPKQVRSQSPANE